jgi:cellulose synthase/poly-beta-1,6-N-acetylglucosamine synthase-like glycosyltransferase
VESLVEGGARRVIVVDDGSDHPESLAILTQLGGHQFPVRIVHLARNRGKAAALQHGFRFITPGSIIIQTDDDTLAGDLTKPAQMIERGAADIVDIRVETARSNRPLALVQALDYWLVNAVTKRVQNWLRARLWLSGASVMYSYNAGQVLIMEKAHTITEDTEALFRARQHGLRVRYCAAKDSQFVTLVPETLPGLRRQWKRWALGNGQVLRMYGFGGGVLRVAIVNACTWFYVLILPYLLAIMLGVDQAIEWTLGAGVVIGIIGAVQLRRPMVATIGILLPLLATGWAFHALEGLFRAFRNPITEDHLTWEPPARGEFLEVPE